MVTGKPAWGLLLLVIGWAIVSYALIVPDHDAVGLGWYAARMAEERDESMAQLRGRVNELPQDAIIQDGARIKAYYIERAAHGRPVHEDVMLALVALLPCGIAFLGGYAFRATQPVRD